MCIVLVLHTARFKKVEYSDIFSKLNVTNAAGHKNVPSSLLLHRTRQHSHLLHFISSKAIIVLSGISRN